MCEYIYLLIEREFKTNNQPIYKVGMTTQENLKRFKQYPKGSTLLFQYACKDALNVEKIILDIFMVKFKQREDIGREYFECSDFNDMVDIIYNCIKTGYKFMCSDVLDADQANKPRIKSSTQTMVNSIDNSFTFINEKCTIDRDSKYLRSDIYRDYIAYMNQPENRGEKSISKSEFFKRMTNRFGEPKKSSSGNFEFRGIGPYVNTNCTTGQSYTTSVHTGHIDV